MSKLLKLYPAFLLGSALLPLAAGAQRLNTILSNVGTTLQYVIGVLFVLATLIFLWGVIQFIAKSGDEQARTKAKGVMTWGIIGLAVMAAAWGIVQILVGYFTVGGEAIPTGLPRGPQQF